MKIQFVWPLACLATLALGWTAGYLMNGAPVPSEQGAKPAQADQSAAAGGKITRHVRENIPATATEEEANERLQALLGALHDPN